MLDLVLVLDGSDPQTPEEPTGLAGSLFFSDLGRPPAFPFARAAFARLLTPSRVAVRRFCVYAPSDSVQKDMTVGLILAQRPGATRADRASFTSSSGRLQVGERHAVKMSIR